MFQGCAGARGAHLELGCLRDGLIYCRSTSAAGTDDDEAQLRCNYMGVLGIDQGNRVPFSSYTS